mgnify:CR=1 FL=1
MVPAVSPEMTNLHPIGSFNSREKIVAELVGRSKFVKDSEEEKASLKTLQNTSVNKKKDQEGKSLREMLKALPDVVVRGNAKLTKYYLKRLGPAWKEDDVDNAQGDIDRALIAEAQYLPASPP